MTRAQRKKSGQGIVQKSCRQARLAQPKDINAVDQKQHAVLLDDLPPELLQEIVGLCADDVYTGRATLLNLSVMNRYLRSATASRLFERIYLRDEPESLGDEILHTLRQFIATPECWVHARTLNLYLKRRNCVGTDHATPTEPYHSLFVPELVAALIKVPKITELYIHMDGKQGRRCLEGLQAAVRWAEGELSIRSVTVSPDSWTGYECDCEQPYQAVDFLAALPKLKAFCFEATVDSWAKSVLKAGDPLHPTIASNLTQLRLYKSRSDPRLGFAPNEWRIFEFSEFDLGELMPQLEYLSILGELRRFPVSRLLEQITTIPKLKYLDITDEQMDDYRGSLEYLRAVSNTPPPRSRSTYFPYSSNHYLNECRSALALWTFDQCPQLQRICFVRNLVGEVYLRDYEEAVADSSGIISDEVKDTDLTEIPTSWRYGVPQTGLIPFPSFNPWQGFKPWGSLE